MLRIASRIGLGLFVLTFPLLLFTTSLRLVINDLSLYESGFQKYGIPTVTGIDAAELNRAAREMVAYFNSREEKIHILLRDGRELFNEKEVRHMEDVKGLVQFGYRVQEGTLAYAALFIGLALLGRGWRWAARGLAWGSALTLALMLILGVSLAVAFDQVFTAFHLVSFSNLLWQLDPATDRLIQMFPEGFFYDASLRIAIVALGLTASLGAVGWGLMRWGRRKA